jgi:hypothetical protein
MKKIVIVALAAAALVAQVGCGKSKVTQCNALIDAANKSQAGFEHVDPDKPEKMKAALEKVKKGNAEVAAVQLEDAKLKGFRDDYVKTHEALAVSFGKLADLSVKLEKAEKSNDAKAAESLGKEAEALEKAMDKDSKDSDKVIEGINSYCHSL